MSGEFILTGMAIMLSLIMKLAIPVSPYPTFPRKQEKWQTNRCASFTLKAAFQATEFTENIESDKVYLSFVC